MSLLDFAEKIWMINSGDKLILELLPASISCENGISTKETPVVISVCWIKAWYFPTLMDTRTYSKCTISHVILGNGVLICRNGVKSFLHYWGGLLSLFYWHVKLTDHRTDVLVQSLLILPSPKRNGIVAHWDDKGCKWNFFGKIV